MCPGGYVVNASSEEGMLAVNGMSYQARDSRNANSAIIVTVNPSDFPEEGVLEESHSNESWNVLPGKPETEKFRYSFSKITVRIRKVSNLEM